MTGIHLHVHSHFSFLEGLAAPAALADSAARLGMPALALTDSGGLTGAIEFYDACRERGVQPLLGLELQVIPPPEFAAASEAPAGTLVLLAAESTGWSSLCRLSSTVSGAAGDARRLAFAKLGEHSAGLLCLTGGSSGLCSRLLGRGNKNAAARWLEVLREAFPDRLYVELNLHTPPDRPLAQRLAVLALNAGLPTVAAQPVYYLQPDQAALQRTAAAIRLNQPLDSLPAEAVAPFDSYFLSPDELARRFRDFPDALAHSDEIAARCRWELALGTARFPTVDLPPGQTAMQVLRLKARQGAERFYCLAAESSELANSQSHAAERRCDLPTDVEARLEHELNVIQTLGYEALFLVMEQIVLFARQQGIPIASRGSASSSLVAHCLGITTPDPVRINLYFERFLNPARSKPPDIDTDLCSRRRDEVIDFVIRHFGVDRVAMVGTINRFRRRSALRETAKAYGLLSKEISSLVDRLPYRWYGPPDRNAAPQDPYSELEAHFTRPPYPQIFADARALIGAPRHLSIHPGGMVIAPQPLLDLAPLQPAPKGVTITQLDLDAIERLGLVKIDLLGIRGLTVLGDVAQYLQRDGDRGVDAPPGSTAPAGEAPIRHAAAHQASVLSALEAIPEDDELTATLISTGRTIGCFQIESPGMRATLREIRARTIDDILVALALYRPGPLTGGLKKAFVARYRGLEPITHIHPALAPLLADTYGVILFQEQVLRIAHDLAGLSLADADLLRRAMSHFDPGKQMQQLKERFIAGAGEHGGVPGSAAEQIWQLMAAFAGYGFPKAHAASYAWVAWQSAWCKAHYPAAFLAAVLANWGGFYSQRIYLTEARRLNLKVQPPLVNYAGPEFTVKRLDGGEALVMGLNQVRELTRRTQERIIKHRPFHSLADFLARADPRPAEAANLVRAGCLADLGSTPGLLKQLEGGGRRGQLPLFETLFTSDEPDWTLVQKSKAQEDILGVGVSAHVLELYAGPIAASGAINLIEAAGKIGERVRVAGMKQTWRRSRTQRGDYIYFMAFEDLEGMMDVVIHAHVYAQGRQALQGTQPLLVEGVVEFDQERGEPYLRAERITAL